MSKLCTVKVEMYIETEDPNLMKRMEHHIEEFMDLDAYPEIKSVYGVTVTKNKEDKENK